MASVEDSLEVVCARQTKIVADKSIGECAGESWDLIALPVSWGGRERGCLCQTMVLRRPRWLRGCLSAMDQDARRLCRSQRSRSELMPVRPPSPAGWHARR